MEREKTTFDDGSPSCTVPRYMKEIVAEVTRQARQSPDISQRSGVSVRVSIANYENLLSNAVKRGIRSGEEDVTPRVSDLPFLVASTKGKIELESGEEEVEEQVIEKLVKNAVHATFNRYFSVGDFDALLDSFRNGLQVEVSDGMGSEEYVRLSGGLAGLGEAMRRLEIGEQPAGVASALEFVLEGLHLNKRLNKERVAGATRYRV